MAREQRGKVETGSEQVSPGVNTPNQSPDALPAWGGQAGTRRLARSGTRARDEEYGKRHLAPTARYKMEVD